MLKMLLLLTYIYKAPHYSGLNIFSNIVVIIKFIRNDKHLVKNALKKSQLNKKRSFQ